MAGEEVGDVVEPELGGYSTVAHAVGGHLASRGSGGALGRQPSAVQQVLGLQISAALRVDESVPVPVEQEQLTLGAGLDERFVQVPALQPRNQRIGNGLGPDHQPGLGLTASAQALGRLGGSVYVTSDPDGGTIWRARLPC